MWNQKRLNDDWEDIPYQADEHDDETVPGEFVSVMVKQNVSLLAAWRIHYGLSQYDVAEQLETAKNCRHCMDVSPNN